MLPKKCVLSKTSILHLNMKFKTLDPKTILLCSYVALTQLVYKCTNLALTHQHKFEFESFAWLSFTGVHIILTMIKGGTWDIVDKFVLYLESVHSFLLSGSVWVSRSCSFTN